MITYFPFLIKKSLTVYILNINVKFDEYLIKNQLKYETYSLCHILIRLTKQVKVYRINNVMSKSDWISPIAIDLGAKNTGVYYAHYEEGTRLSDIDRVAS